MNIDIDTSTLSIHVNIMKLIDEGCNKLYENGATAHYIVCNPSLMPDTIEIMGLKVIHDRFCPLGNFYLMQEPPKIAHII